MKIRTLEQINFFAQKPDWNHTQEIEIIDTVFVTQKKFIDGKFEPITIAKTFGIATLTSKRHDITITFTQNFSFTNEADLRTKGANGREIWSITGVTLTNCDYEAINAHCLADYLPPQFSNIDYSGLDYSICDNWYLKKSNKTE